MVTFHNRMTKVLFASALCALSAMMLSGCFWDDGDEEPEEEPVVSIAFTLNAPDADEDALPATVKVGKKSDMAEDVVPVKLHGLIDTDAEVMGDAGNEDEAADVVPFDEKDLMSFQVVPNMSCDLKVYEPSVYMIYVSAPPVNMDGSSYIVSTAAIEVDVKEGVLRTEAQTTLERLSAADMTKEQLEASADALIEQGRIDEAKAVMKFAEQAPSGIPSDSLDVNQGIEGVGRTDIVTSEDKSIDHASETERSEKQQASSGDGLGSAGSPSPPVSFSQEHVHDYVYKVDEPARTETIYKVSETCDQCHKRFSSIDAFVRHLERGKRCSTHTPTKIAVGTKQVPEKGHQECSCGARK